MSTTDQNEGSTANLTDETTPPASTNDSTKSPTESTPSAETAKSEEAMETATGTAEAAGTTANPVNEDDRKLFVGGLPQDAKESDITEYFAKFGAIDGVNLKTDSQTGRSRGFAFVIFKAEEGVTKACACAEDEHQVKGKKVAVKKAMAKQGKVYVGKLKPEISDDDIKEFFSKYGNIVSVEQPFDKVKNERKNFCFITFEKEEPAKTLLKEGVVSVKDHELEIKKVTPKNETMRGGGFGGMRGGRGGGWGGYGAGGAWGGYGGGDYWDGSGMADYYGAYGGWDGGWGGYGAVGGYPGGKMPRGRGAPRGGRGNMRGARPKPY